MTEAARRRWQWVAAALWALAVGVVVAGMIGVLRAPLIETDVLALLPDDAHDARVAQADAAVLGEGNREVLVLLRATDADQVIAAARVVRERLSAQAPTLRPLPLSGNDGGLDAATLGAIAGARHGLLAPSIHQALASKTVDEFSQLALARLYSPFDTAPGPGVLADPLGLVPAWLDARAGGWSVVDGELMRVTDDGHLVLLRYRIEGRAFGVDGSTPLADALASARRELDAAVSGSHGVNGADIELQAVGVPLIAEAAAAQASREMSTIGLGSLLAIILIVAVCFRGPLPVVLVATSLVVGIGAAFVATHAVFGGIHVLTLVFGATLVGVAEDYGIHYFAARQGDPARDGVAQLDRLLPGLLLALATSVLAYAAIGLAPFPGLRQMALFSAVGLMAAFLTVVCWLPLWPRRAPAPSALSRRVSASLARWPRFERGRSRAAAFAVAAAVALAAVGLPQLRVDDSVRSLQGVPPEVMAAQMRIADLLDLPSPAQYFIVEADDVEALLQREERLTDALHRERQSGEIGGWQALSDAVPSLARQQLDAARVQPIEAAVRERLIAALGGEAEVSTASPVSPPSSSSMNGSLPISPLTLEAWLASPLSMADRGLWLGERDGRVASLVRVSGLRPDDVPRMAAQAGEGVRWVDRTADYSALLATYRSQIQTWLLIGVLAVGAALALRFGRDAWRALVPTLLAGAVALGVQGLIGEPLQLFNVLALMLLLGVGVDYGIFLVEHQDDGASWLAVSLGAVSTLLGFGLLALSQTPALHGFGLTMLVGVGAVWLLAPIFRTPPRNAASPQSPKETRHAH